MEDKITSRVRKLIALAESTHSEEEARTAAREAVRLIAKHSLLGRPAAPQPKPQPQVPRWDGPLMCKAAWKGRCEVCGSPLRGMVYWLGKRTRHSACHIAKGSR